MVQTYWIKKYYTVRFVCPWGSLDYTKKVFYDKTCHLEGWLTKLQWATKVLRHLVVEFDFLVSWSHFAPFPPKQCWFFYFFDYTDHSAHTTLNWGAGGIRELTLDANKIEQTLKYRKASFPKSVSTTFVAHCLESIYVNCGDFRYVFKL